MNAFAYADKHNLKHTAAVDLSRVLYKFLGLNVGKILDPKILYCQMHGLSFGVGGNTDVLQ